MDSVRQWSALISTSSVICILIEFLIPPGKIGKSMNMVLGVFMLVAFITPFTSKNGMFDMDFKKISRTEKLCDQKNVVENLNSQIADVAKQNIKAVITRNLRDINVNPKKIQIFMDTNETGCIVMIRCQIHLDESQSDLKEKIKSEIESKLKIKTEVKVDV